jgi:hypothetical protein
MLRKENYIFLIIISVIFIGVVIGIFFHKSESKCKCKECKKALLTQQHLLGNGCTAGCTAAGGACQVLAAINVWDEPEAGLACAAIMGTCMESCNPSSTPIPRPIPIPKPKPKPRY